MQAVKLIVGLGNPGAEYSHTRHNAGVWFIDKLIQDASGTLSSEKKFSGLAGKFTISSESFCILIPETYMNCSGRSVQNIAKFYKIPPQAILIAHDELALPAGIVRLKQGGGHAGHNGLRDIINNLGSNDFLRLRIGIGHPGVSSKVTNYVLSAPKKIEKKLIDHSIDNAIQVLPLVLKGQLQEATQSLGMLLAK